MKYRAITSENFYLTEIRNVARALVKDWSRKENLKEFLLNENLLDTETENNFNKKFLSISKRINGLSKGFVELMSVEDSDIGRFLNLYAICYCERIIFEFMNEVISNKYRAADYYLFETDFKEFMIQKSEEDDTINFWSEASKKKILCKIKNFLIEGNFLRKEEEHYRIIKPIIPNYILNILEQYGEKKFLKAMLY
ncbi:MAG: BrxA family protein [Fusobacteriaceae bacterium]